MLLMIWPYQSRAKFLSTRMLRKEVGAGSVGMANR